MRLFSRNSPPATSDELPVARVRVDRSTKTLVKRLQRGEVAVIQHTDLDRLAADGLIERQPLAVLNASPSISGRYPNLGPEVLIKAGIPLIDDLGPAVMSLKEGSRVVIGDHQVLSITGEVIAEGVRQTAESVEEAMENAKAGLSVQLEAFAANTMEFIQKERELLLDSVGVPKVKTDFTDRHVLIVVRGYTYKEDLAMLRSYIREYRPLLVGVDGGADAIMEAGYKVNMIVGDMDSVSDAALKSGAEIVVHAYRDGRAPGRERVQQLGLEHVVFPATGTSEDIAMLLADDKGATLLVAVGTHETLVEFLDKGRSGMASTFLTRLRVGGKLIDAKGVSRLYRHRISSWQLTFLAIAGLVAFGAAILATPAGQAFMGILQARLDDFISWVQVLFGG